MESWLPEQKVLKNLGIENFGQLGKKNSIHFASMLDKMEPEVAQKALQQFPEFAKTAKEILYEYKDVIDNGMTSNDASMRAVYDVYNSVIISLQKELDKENLTFEEKKYILEQMKVIADKIDKKDTENKKWIAGIVMVAGAVCLGVVAMVAGLLGGDTSVKTTEPPDSDSDSDSDFDIITDLDNI